MKNTIAFLTAFFTVLPGIPAGWFTAQSFAPEAGQNESLFWIIAVFAVMVSYPVYTLQIWFLFAKKYLTVFGLIVTGILARMSGLGAVAVWFMLKNQAMMQSAVVIYFSFIAAFLLFELVSIIALLIYDSKYRLKDKNS